MNSLQNINILPSIEDVRKTSQGLALVDAIIMPEWEYRYFSFDNKWSEDGSEMMASMRDGSGAEYFLHFSEQGLVGKVLSEKLLDDYSSYLDGIPNCFLDFKNESAFNLDNATFFFWKKVTDKNWHTSPSNINKFPLLGFIVNGVSEYHSWAEEYYEKDIDKSVLIDVFTSLSISSDQLSILNSDLTMEDIKDDILEISP
jgi:hypothetical protein